MAQWAAAAMKPLGHTGCENGRATPIGSPPPLPSMPCTPGARISPCCAARLCMWLTALAPPVAGFEADCCCLLSSHPAPLALLNGCMWISQPPAAGQPPATLDCLDCLDSSCPCIGRRGFGALPADYLPLSNSQRQSPSCSPACRYSNLPCRQRPPRPPHPQGIGLDIVCRHLGMPNDTASRQRHYVRSWRCTTRSVLSCADHTELHVTLMASSAPLMHHTHLPLSGSR
jgi:hypothetical protein